MSLDTPTPRTDAFFREDAQNYPAAEFCRDLERDLNELKASTLAHTVKQDQLEVALQDISTGLPEDFRRIALLFTSRCTRTKMTQGEKRAWASATVKEHDLELLEWFYALDKSADFDSTWRRVGMPATLLNNLNAQLDLAYEHKEALRKSQPKLGTAPQW